MSAYRELEIRFRRIDALGGALSVLRWDQAAMMPPGGAEARAEQIATLAVLHHREMTDPYLADLLAEAEAEPDEVFREPERGPWARANLREMRRLWRHAGALPSGLIEARSRAASACEFAWRRARAEADFAGLIPSFREVIARTREAAFALGEAFGLAPYDALLEENEPMARAAEIDPLFQDLADFLPGFIAEARVRQNDRRAPLPPEPFPVEAQRRLGLRLMEALGFDFRHGRLDVSLHPYTGGVPDDVRITTRYSEADFTRSLMAVLHETGHALYERGLPAPWRGQPVGEARGMVLHESQSLLIEMQVCRSPEFLRFLAPLLAEAFSGEGPLWQADNLARLYSRVEPGPIRVDADEMTYPLHVILRYRLEQALLAGDLELADLPAAWNEGMEKLLGVRPKDDAEGCLQDIHWPAGAFGYFPTYSLGALAAAQLFAAARRQDPAIPPGIEKGDFKPLLSWLRAHVHGLGSLYSTREVIERATGAPLGTEAFKAHLKARYLAG
jgi:carboxypeptidase Taq